MLISIENSYRLANHSENCATFHAFINPKDILQLLNANSWFASNNPSWDGIKNQIIVNRDHDHHIAVFLMLSKSWLFLVSTSNKEILDDNQIQLP